VIDLKAARKFNEQHEPDCPARKVKFDERVLWYMNQPIDSEATFTLPGGCCALRSSYEVA